ncbi:MAG TPA: UDP-3-O-(3-hydroxymyristoyl)glucosamine N-acyltransferase [Vicinamibacterales bacterium]|jgi:UDP-3-O-[3-hydroxymyristoyl] glucosamine N-acyltransferase
MQLGDIAQRLDCRLDGDGQAEVFRVAGIEQAGPGDLTFLANGRYLGMLARTKATAIILRDTDPPAPCATLRTGHPYLAFAEALRLFVEPSHPAPGIDPLSSIAPDAEIGAGVSVGPFVVIGAHARIGAGSVLYPNVVVGVGAAIGRDCIIHANVSIRERVILGDRVIIQNGAVIGGDGYGFVKRADGSYLKIPQTADVVLEDDVEVGANTTIDRPAVGETRIKQGAKIDNLVQIAHGVVIGRHTLLAAQVGVAGSTAIGDSVTLAGQVGVAGHLEIGAGTIATAQTGIPNSLDERSFVSGYPAIGNREWLKSSAVFRKLPALRKQVSELERRIAELEARLAAVGHDDR